MILGVQELGEVGQGAFLESVGFTVNWPYNIIISLKCNHLLKNFTKFYCYNYSTFIQNLYDQTVPKTKGLLCLQPYLCFCVTELGDFGQWETIFYIYSSRFTDGH